MFYSNDPVRDYDNYCDYCERQNKEWHEENDKDIIEKIENLEYLIDDLKKCNTSEEVEEIIKSYNQEQYFESKEEEIEYFTQKIAELEEELRN